jgi:hypothetical protein
MRISLLLSLSLLCGAAAPAAAQAPPLTLPQPSPKAGVTQTVGITDIAITYHRPAASGRKIWGDLVPYGEVWRAGANENTTISFSTPVKVAGRPLAAGTYGLHMIPGQKDWTVIFSGVSGAWGSYGYNPKEDVLRVTVASQAAEPTERLAFTFDDPTNTSVLVTLRWEKLKVPVPIQVDTPQVVMASIRKELRGVGQFFGATWARAARYWLENNGDLDEALRFADRAVRMGETFQSLDVRAKILAKKGDAKGAAESQARALKVASEGDFNNYGYQLLAAKKMDEALAVFEKNVKEHPTSWNAYDSLGEAQALKGDKKAALASYARALALIKEREPGDGDNRRRIEKVLARLGK